MLMKVELERQKALVLQYYQENIAQIDQIAGGAMAQLEEKRKRKRIKQEKQQTESDQLEDFL